MKQVTLGHEDIEFFDAITEAARDAIFDDDTFADYVQTNGLENALQAVSVLHRNVANQLIRADPLGIGRYPNDREWAGRAIYVCLRAKRRRDQLRRMYRLKYGFDRLEVWLRNFALGHPRAVRPSK